MSTEIDQQTESVEHLDFEPGCTYTLHPFIGRGPAAWLVHLPKKFSCGCAPIMNPHLWCGRCLHARTSTPSVACTKCGSIYSPRSEHLRVEPLR